MPMFVCDLCGCGENTALGHFWGRESDYFGPELKGKALCSECMPDTFSDGSKNEDGGKWHGRFEKQPALPNLIEAGRYINRTKTGQKIV